MKVKGARHLERYRLSDSSSSFVFKSSSNWIQVFNCSFGILFNYVNQGIAEEKLLNYPNVYSINI